MASKATSEYLILGIFLAGEHTTLHGSFLVKRIFWSTPNGILMVHTEWLTGVRLRHSVHIEECKGWWLSGCRSSVAMQDENSHICNCKYVYMYA